MKKIPTFLATLLRTSLFVLFVVSAFGDNPETGDSTKSHDPGCGGCSGALCNAPKIASFDWSINVGKARYPKPDSFLGISRVAYEKDGHLPDLKGKLSRNFPSTPLQQTPNNMKISQTQISAASFHPKSLFLESSAEREQESMGDGSGDMAGDFIRQIVTDDSFTHVEMLGTGPNDTAAGSGFKVRVWRKDAAALAKLPDSEYYDTAPFDAVTVIPLVEASFTRAVNGNDNILIYTQKERTGTEAAAKVLTNVISQTLTAAGKPDVVTSLLYDGVHAYGTGAEGSPMRKEIVTYTYPANARKWDYTLVREVWEAALGADGNLGALALVSKTREVYRDFSPTGPGGDLGMKRLMSLTQNAQVPPNPAVEQTTTYAYVDQPANATVHGRLQSTTRPDGSWNFFTYVMGEDGADSVITEYSSWLDLSVDQKANARKTITTISGNLTVSKTYVASQLVASSRMTLQADNTGTTTTSEQSDGTEWHVTENKYHLDADPDVLKRGRLKKMTRPDGTTVDYTYAGALGAETVTAVDSAGTTVVTAYGLGGVALAQTTTDGLTGLAVESWVGIDPDASGRPTRRNFNGDPVNDYEIMRYACCGLEFSRTRDGRETDYLYDPLRRVKTTVSRASANSPNVMTINVIDGLTSTQWRQVGNGPQLFLGTVTNTLDGLTQTSIGPSNTVVSPAAEAARPVTTSVTAHIAGTGDRTITTDALGGTTITARFLDGQTKSVTGTAVADMTYSYETHADAENGGGMKTGTTSVGLTAFIYTDMLGRAFKTEAPATGTTTTTYHPISAAVGARGKMASTTDADGVAVSYGYNAKGEKTSVSRLVPTDTGNATLVTTTERDVVPNVSLRETPIGTCFRTTQKVASTGEAEIVVSESFSSITGLATGTREFASVARETLSTRPRLVNGLAVSIAVDGTRTETTTTNGLVESVVRKNSASATIQSTSYGYDPLQRPLTVTDSRTGTTTYDVDGDGLADLTESGLRLAVKAPNEDATHYTHYEYDALGRPILTTLPDGTATHTAYYLTGQVKARWGSQTYPEFRIYDEANRLTELRTYKDLNAEPTATIINVFAATKWIYDGKEAANPTVNKGLLGRKLDAMNIGPTYAYSPAGRLKTRTWARQNSGANIVTSYGHTHGFLTATTYSDATPEVLTTYDPFGRVKTVTQFKQSQIAYAYAADFSIDTETVRYDLNGDGDFTDLVRTIDRSVDALGRNIGWQLNNGTTTPDHQADYAYDTAGRFSTASDASSTFTYGYQYNQTVPGDPREGATNGTKQDFMPYTLAKNGSTTLEAKRTYEARRDVLAVIENLAAGTPRSRHSYSVNYIGQRTNLATAFDLGGATANPGATAWGYDSLGQVESADAPAAVDADRHFEYDTIGNRLRSRTGTATGSGGALTEYFAGTTGTPAPGANPLNQYGRITFPGPINADPTYDLDGNQLTGHRAPVTGAVVFEWDAENRLTAVKDTSAQVLVTYEYDAMSRRIRKTVPATGADIAFVYDGWNPVAEYTLGGATPALARRNTWGLDLSGGIEGAGGVGGLLATEIFSGATVTGLFFPTYDGNGNVSEYLNGTGAVAAHFEYDPFGNTVVNTDTANNFPFRFSTKYQDAETGLLYYGYRYYDPITGRWLSRDPIEEEGGLNLYGFVGNSSVGTVDMLGLKWLPAIHVGADFYYGFSLLGGNEKGGTGYETAKTRIVAPQFGQNGCGCWCVMKDTGIAEVEWAYYTVRAGGPQRVTAPIMTAGMAQFGSWHENTEIKLLEKLYMHSLKIAEERAQANICAGPETCNGFASKKALEAYIKWNKAYDAYRAETKTGSHFDQYFGMTVKTLSDNKLYFVPEKQGLHYNEQFFDQWYAPKIYAK